MSYLALSLTLGFLAVLIGTRYGERYLLASGIFARDQQKEDRPTLPTSGGVIVLFGFLLSITVYLGLSSFFELAADASLILAALSSVTIITLIGLIDDIHVNLKLIVKEEMDIDAEKIQFQFEERFERQLPHQKLAREFTAALDRSGTTDENMIREGLGQTSKMLFVLPAVFPLMAVGAGSWTMSFPYIGSVSWGVIYPLFLLPVGLLFVSNVVNMLAGTNGLAASLSFVTSSTLGVYALMNSEIEAALIAFSLAVSLLGFLYYNFYPASILEGDSLTYLCGAAMFSSIVIGNMERFGVLIFAPWIAEFLLKARSGFKAHSWGELQNDGTLKPLHEKNYSLTHPLMRRGLSERQVTLALTAVQTLICLSALFLFTTVM